jgi:transcriptional regulator with XRE-family HTH domain
MYMTDLEIHSKESVAARLVAVREFLGFSQKEFAAALGLSKAQVNDWENARVRVSLPGALKIYERFNVDLNFLFLDDRNMLPHKMAVALSSNPANK